MHSHTIFAFLGRLRQVSIHPKDALAQVCSVGLKLVQPLQCDKTVTPRLGLKVHANERLQHSMHFQLAGFWVSSTPLGILYPLEPTALPLLEYILLPPPLPLPPPASRFRRAGPIAPSMQTSLESAFYNFPLGVKQLNVRLVV